MATKRKPKTKPKTKPVRKPAKFADLPPVRSADLAVMLNVSPKTIATWAAAGVVKRVGYGRFDLAASVRGFADHMREANEAKGELTVAMERAALLRMQRQKGELAMDQALGRLCDADEMVASFQKDMTAVRQSVLALPDRISHRCGGLSHATVVAMKAEVADVLTDLASGKDEIIPTAEDVGRAMAIREARGLVRDLGPPRH